MNFCCYFSFLQVFVHTKYVHIFLPLIIILLVAGVYARVSYFYDWIAETACTEFPDDVPSYFDCPVILGRAGETEPPTPPPIPSPTTAAPTITASPSSVELPKLTFLAWTPDRSLELCEGDCDTDDDCNGDDLVCLQRDGKEESNEVPGCSNPDGIANNVDVCIKAEDARRHRKG